MARIFQHYSYTKTLPYSQIADLDRAGSGRWWHAAESLDLGDGAVDRNA